jgi:hypothetical protein
MVQVNEGDEVELEVESGGYIVVEVVAVSDSIEDRSAGILYERVFGGGRGRALTEDINRVLG